MQSCGAKLTGPSGGATRLPQPSETLPEDVKKRLRLRAATNGRLDGRGESASSSPRGAADAPVRSRLASETRQGRSTPTSRPRRVLLIISGGIAAYKSLDLIRRLRERGIAVRVVMTQAAQRVRHAAVGRRAHRRASRSRTCSIRTDEYDVGHIQPRARHRPRRRRAGHRRPDGQDGERACRRSGHRRRCSRPTSRSCSRRP